LIALALGLVAPAATGQDAAVRIKAAFLYKFTAYVEWPRAAFPQVDSPLVIGTLGAPELTRELEIATAGKQVAGRSVQVRRVERVEDAAGCCQMLFLGPEVDAARALEVLTRTQLHPVLTVTDAEAAHPNGSVINFIAADNRIRFDISRERAERKGLHLSSQLLGVARQVVQR